MKRCMILCLALSVLLLSGCSGAKSAPGNAYGGVPDVYDAKPAEMAQGEELYELAPDGLPEPEQEWNTEEYDHVRENSFRSVAAEPFATFAADVDTASYTNFRRQVLQSGRVDRDSVRIEEFLNYFRYDYPEPADGEPFSVTTEVAPCPWNEKTQLLSVGLQAKKTDPQQMPRANLVFLIDVSGSMDEWNKLPLVQRSFLTLTENLNRDDVVSIVTYSSGETIVLDGGRADDPQKIASAIESLTAHGSTRGDRAIEMAYELARKHYVEGGVNRVIMATDGDFNVGVTSEGELTRLIEDNAKSGVFLSILGYGMGNYKDSKLESMADNGNGNYAYVDSIDEARRVLVSEAGGTLFTVAKDVKLQVEFNPARVRGYRLIGYENRVMSAADFTDDTKDGGEIGAGHQVTALFEIVPADSDFEIPAVESKYGQASAQPGGEFSDELCTVSIRYKQPEGSESALLSYPVGDGAVRGELSGNLQWAAGVAEAAMLLKDSAYKGTATYETAKELLQPIAQDNFRREFLLLLDRLK